MAVSETLVEVALVFSRDRAWALQAYSDGFDLNGWIDGESGHFRHWPLGSAWIATTDANALQQVGAHDCAAGAVSLPTGVEPPSAAVVARLRWPVAASGRMERQGDEVRYELRVGDAQPNRWFAATDSAWFGVSGGGELCRVVVTAPTPARERVTLRLPGERYAASLAARRYLHVELERSGVPEGWPASPEASRYGESYEASRGNGSVSLGPAGTLETLWVYDVAEGDAMAFDREAPSAGDGVEGWQDWPADVRAVRWHDARCAWVGVTFGAHAAATWSRLSADAWAGTTAEGEVAAIVFGGVEEPDLRHERDDEDAGLGEVPWVGRAVEVFPELTFAVYGLVGELGVPGAVAGGVAGVVSSLGITFGDREGRRWLQVTSSRNADLDHARVNLASDLVPPDDVPDGDSRESLEAWSAAELERHRQVRNDIREGPWLPVEIRVDGDPSEWWSYSSGDRWAALTRIEHTTITLVGQGYDIGDIALERITDLEPHAEHARRQELERVERTMRELGHDWPIAARRRTPEERERRAEVRAAIHGLTDALHRNAGAPDLGELFTDRVAGAWGGRERYEKLLWLHTMLRPITGSGTRGDYPRLNGDGTADMRMSVHHAATDGSPSHASFRIMATAGEPEPEPDRGAIDRGEAHNLDLRLIRSDERWLIDTDLLAILIDRVGSIEHVAQPLSLQGGGT
jgi:hypothetical protein